MTDNEMDTTALPSGPQYMEHSSPASGTAPERLGSSSLWELQPNEGDLPGYVRFWKCVENVQAALRELGVK